MPHILPALPYPHDALEPHLDAQTMEIHHGRHHQTYVTQLNAALQGTPYAELAVEDLLQRFALLPQELHTAVRNHGGGHANHSLFWLVMAPAGLGGGGRPGGALATAIDEQLGGFEAFQKAFTQAAVSRFGSGWAWLSVTPEQRLVVESSANQDSPLMQGHRPILGLDVWEHAYYLRFQNKRADYIQAFYKVVHWPEVERRYQAALAQA